MPHSTMTGCVGLLKGGLLYSFSVSTLFSSLHFFRFKNIFLLQTSAYGDTTIEQAGIILLKNSLLQNRGAPYGYTNLYVLFWSNFSRILPVDHGIADPDPFRLFNHIVIWKVDGSDLILTTTSPVLFCMVVVNVFFGCSSKFHGASDSFLNCN